MTRNRNTALRRFLFSSLGKVPGKIGLKFRRKFRRLFWKENEAKFIEALEQTKGMVQIDLGANVGQFTEIMASYGGPVHSFEPDPWTCERLRERVGSRDNVFIHQAAAGNRDGSTKFFRRIDFGSAPLMRSQAASTIASKINMDHQNSLDVTEVDLARFLAELDGEVGVLKIDIEGAEVPLLEHLLESPALQRVHYVFCETHETMIDELADRTEALRERVSKIQRPVFNMDWH